ncbi:unnamed protein product [Phytophthora fragariaefolia]|uniref:Unnamed protein product n=1 Tax=Phytophthora fragariaefolia TaxID=1490495 RepID=A0A9W7CWX6_9STRA|nr:unnamed protein product [Phytophthora fragariaefolia]
MMVGMSLCSVGFLDSAQRSTSEHDRLVAHCEHMTGLYSGLFCDGSGDCGSRECDGGDSEKAEELHGYFFGGAAAVDMANRELRGAAQSTLKPAKQHPKSHGLISDAYLPLPYELLGTRQRQSEW